MADNRSTVLVVGLGRFGAALALELESLGHEVLAIDSRETAVQEWAPRVTHAVVADATDHDTLLSLGVADLARAEGEHVGPPRQDGAGMEEHGFTGRGQAQQPLAPALD